MRGSSANSLAAVPLVKTAAREEGGRRLVGQVVGGERAVDLAAQALPLPLLQ